MSWRKYIAAFIGCGFATAYHGFSPVACIALTGATTGLAFAAAFEWLESKETS